MPDKTLTPRHGWRLAWRQNHPNYSGLSHRHSTTIFPADDREHLETLCVAVNAGFRLPDGSPGIVQWIEWYDSEITDICTGNYWGVTKKRVKRNVE